MKSNYIIILLISLLSGSCVTPYDITPNYVEAIVIEGMITDQPGPYVVTISKSIPLDEQLQTKGLLSGAAVIISDDLGNSETLVEKSKGNYYTTLFQGVIGRSYSITITVEDKSYQSASEKLLPVGDFVVRYQFEQNEDPNTNQQITSTNGFNFYVDSELLPEQEGRVWWRWNGTFHYVTYPQNHTRFISGFKGAVVEVPDAPPCAFSNTDGYQCHDCWVTRYNQTPLLSDKKFIENDQIKSLKIGFAEVNRRSFYDKYYLEVEQLSLSASVYDFWKSVKTGKGNSSNLFQTPPPKTIGNIKATLDEAIPVLGYFSASSVKKHSVTLDRSEVPYPIWNMDPFNDVCALLYTNASYKKPKFW
jgi:hypothetical protein